MHNIAVPLCDATSVEDLAFSCKKVQHRVDQPFVDSVTMIKLRKLKKVRFTVSHRGEIEKQSKLAPCILLSALNLQALLQIRKSGP